MDPRLACGCYGFCERIGLEFRDMAVLVFRVEVRWWCAIEQGGTHVRDLVEQDELVALLRSCEYKDTVA